MPTNGVFRIKPTKSWSLLAGLRRFRHRDMSSEGLAVTLGTFLPFTCLGVVQALRRPLLWAPLLATGASLAVLSCASHKETPGLELESGGLFGTWLWWSKPFWDPILGVFVYFSGDWDVQWGYGIVTHGDIGCLVWLALAWLGCCSFFVIL